jgi:hypothetical protein
MAALFAEIFDTKLQHWVEISMMMSGIETVFRMSLIDQELV